MRKPKIEDWCFCVRLQGSSGSPFSGSEGRALQAGSETPGDAADEEDEQDGAGVLPSREQLQAYLSEMLLSPMDGEEEVDRDLPQYASLEGCAEALKQCGIGLRSAQQLFPTRLFNDPCWLPLRWLWLTGNGGWQG